MGGRKLKASRRRLFFLGCIKRRRFRDKRNKGGTTVTMEEGDTAKSFSVLPHRAHAAEHG